MSVCTECGNDEPTEGQALCLECLENTARKVRTMSYTIENSTEWVCVGCHLAIAGYSDDEAGETLPRPYSTDDTVTDVVNGSPIDECEFDPCTTAGPEFDGSDAAIHDAHSEHDHDSFSLSPCDSCGSTLAGDRYAVTVERTTED